MKKDKNRDKIICVGYLKEECCRHVTTAAILEPNFKVYDVEFVKINTTFLVFSEWHFSETVIFTNNHVWSLVCLCSVFRGKQVCKYAHKVQYR